MPLKRLIPLPNSRWLPLLLLPLIGLALSAFLAQTALYQRVSYWAHDATQQWLGRPVDLSGVAVIDVDEESMTRLQPQLGPWPYERDIYALVTRYLLSGGARSVVFDVLFSEARGGDAEGIVGGVAGGAFAAAAAGGERRHDRHDENRHGGAEQLEGSHDVSIVSAHRSRCVGRHFAASRPLRAATLPKRR